MKNTITETTRPVALQSQNVQTMGVTNETPIVLTQSYVENHKGQIITWYSIQFGSNAPAIGKCKLIGLDEQGRIESELISGDELDWAFFANGIANYGDDGRQVMVGEPPFYAWTFEYETKYYSNMGYSILAKGIKDAIAIFEAGREGSLASTPIVSVSNYSLRLPQAEYHAIREAESWINKRTQWDQHVK